MFQSLVINNNSLLSIPGNFFQVCQDTSVTIPIYPSDIYNSHSEMNEWVVNDTRNMNHL